MAFEINNGVLVKRAGDPDITSVVIADSVKEIGEGTFRECVNLQSVIIMDGVTKIGSWAFGECAKLQSVTIPDSVKKIDASAFEDCEKLVVTAPAGSYAIEYAKVNNIRYKEI